MNLIAIDPGVASGIAFFLGGYLYRCARFKPYDGERIEPLILPPAECVIEIPQVYRASKSKGDPNDLIKLATVAGRLAEYYESRGLRVQLVKPREWKGQLPKKVMQNRLLGTRGPQWTRDEINALAGAANRVGNYDHNVLDAVALGMWRLGRFKL